MRFAGISVVVFGMLGTCWSHPKASQSQWKTLDGSPPKIFAHRGEKVLMPEHTIGSYEVAAILGADYVEPDLCLTKDNRLVCYHDLELGSGTDVTNHPEFDHLKHNTSHGYDWYIQNFTLAELKTLKVVQKRAGVRPQYLNFFSIPTFEEYLDTVHRLTFKLNRTIGVIPELKSPAFHNSVDQRAPNTMEQRVLLAFSSYGYPVNSIYKGNCYATVDGAVYPIPCPPVILQCFEFGPLEYLKSQTNFELLYLAEEEHEYLTYKGMEKIATVASHYTTWKEYAYVGVEAELAYNNVAWNATLVDGLGGFIKPQEFANEAHRNGMKFGVYTIYDSREPSLRGCALTTGCERDDKTAELRYFSGIGADSVFVENVAESREILLQYENDRVNGRLTGGAGVVPATYVPGNLRFGFVPKILSRNLRWL